MNTWLNSYEKFSVYSNGQVILNRGSCKIVLSPPLSFHWLSESRKPAQIAADCTHIFLGQSQGTGEGEGKAAVNCEIKLNFSGTSCIQIYLSIGGFLARLFKFPSTQVTRVTYSTTSDNDDSAINSNNNNNHNTTNNKIITLIIITMIIYNNDKQMIITITRFLSFTL